MRMLWAGSQGADSRIGSGRALLLSAADTIARNLLSVEIPVGVLTTLLAAVFLLYL